MKSVRAVDVRDVTKSVNTYIFPTLLIKKKEKTFVIMTNKRPRTTSSERDNKPVVATFFELWDVSVFNAIAELVLPPELENSIKDMYKDINKTNFSYRKVEYRKGEFVTGRMYGKGLQSIPRWIRRLCAHKHYIDIDIANCGPTLFAQLLEMNGVPLPSLLKMYADNRNDMFDLIRQFDPTLTEADMKRMLLKISHGGEASEDGTPPIGPLASYKSQIQKAAMELKTRPRYASTYRERVEAREYNPLGSFIACVWQEVEDMVLRCIIDHFQSNGHRVGAPVFDGLLVEKHDAPDLAGAKCCSPKDWVPY